MTACMWALWRQIILLPQMLDFFAKYHFIGQKMAKNGQKGVPLAVEFQIQKPTKIKKLIFDSSLSQLS